MTFQQAVHSTPDVCYHYHPGLQALQPNHRRLVSCPNPRTLAGSVNIDAALLSSHPNQPRWDYCIGLQKGSDQYVAV